jgi:hypothetical protein
MKFNSKTLQAIFEQTQPILEHLKPRDPLTEDIQELEQYLLTLQLKESFVFNLRFPKTPAYEEDLLVWNHHKQRLLYIKNRYRVTCLSHENGYYQHINYNDKEIVLETPLEDASLEIKQLIAEEDKLALFLSLLAERSRTTRHYA